MKKGQISVYVPHYTVIYYWIYSIIYYESSKLTLTRLK